MVESATKQIPSRRIASASAAYAATLARGYCLLASKATSILKQNLPSGSTPRVGTECFPVAAVVLLAGPADAVAARVAREALALPGRSIAEPAARALQRLCCARDRY